MEEKDLNNVTSNEGKSTETEFDPIEAIREIKENSVSRDEYLKLKAEKDKYLKALIEGSQVETEKKEPVDVDQLRKDLFTTDLSALEYAKKSLQLRDAIIDRDGVDIFVANGEKISATDEDYEKAQKVADAFQSCIDIADGDSEIFTRELMRITKDIAPQNSINPKIRR